MAPPNIHENLSRKHAVRGPSDRNFGFVFTVFFVLLGLAPLRKHLPMRWWALALALVFLAITLLRASLLRPLNRVWMRFGHLLGRITTPIVTGLLFFLIFTPLGLLARLFGKDSLRLASDKTVVSYWVERQPPGPPPEEMSNQF